MLIPIKIALQHPSYTLNTPILYEKKRNIEFQIPLIDSTKEVANESINGITVLMRVARCVPMKIHMNIQEIDEFAISGYLQ